MHLVEWFVSVLVSPLQEAAFGVADAERLWCVIIEWAEERELGVGGSYRLEGTSFVYELGVAATREDQLIPDDEMRQLLRIFRQELAGIARASGGFRPFTDEESDPVRLEQLIERVDSSIN
jgi:hypothetical protein